MILDGNVVSMSSVGNVSGFFSFVIGSIVKCCKKWNVSVVITAKGCLNSTGNCIHCSCGVPRWVSTWLITDSNP
jgi:hypothetical protein